MPPFPFPDPDVDVWGAFPVDAPFAQSRQPAWLSGLGRLKPGVTIEQARADLALVQSRLGAQYPDTDRGVAVHLEPLAETLVGDARGSFWLLFGAVSGTPPDRLHEHRRAAAVANDRARQEIAVRASLGASRSPSPGRC